MSKSNNPQGQIFIEIWKFCNFWSIRGHYWSFQGHLIFRIAWNLFFWNQHVELPLETNFRRNLTILKFWGHFKVTWGHSEVTCYTSFESSWKNLPQKYFGFLNFDVWFSLERSKENSSHKKRYSATPGVKFVKICCSDFR